MGQDEAEKLRGEDQKCKEKGGVMERRFGGSRREEASGKMEPGGRHPGVEEWRQPSGAGRSKGWLLPEFPREHVALLTPRFRLPATGT